MTISGNRALGFIIVVLMTLYLFATFELDDVALGGPVGPKVYPFLLGSIGMLSGLALLFNFKGWRRNQEGGDPSGNIVIRMPKNPIKLLAVAGVLVWAFIYGTLIDEFGFMIACSIFLLGMSLYFNRGMIILNVFVSLAFPAAVYFGWKALGINLPNGVLAF